MIYSPTLPQNYTIIDTQAETQDIFTFHLSSSAPPNKSIRPGQFNMLYVPGVGEAAISSSRIHSDNTLTHTIRVVGSVTRNLQQLRIGDIVGVRGPFGTPWPIHVAYGKSIVLIAGGIGIAPLRPLIDELTRQRDRFLNVTLVYGARSINDLLYQNEWAMWEKALRVYVTIDRATTPWKGHVGVVTQPLPFLIDDPSNTIVMMCGPEIMMRFCYFVLRDENVPPENIYMSMERNMQCGYGQCGHCQWGPYFICKDGPVMRFDKMAPFFFKSEL